MISEMIFIYTLDQKDEKMVSKALQYGSSGQSSPVISLDDDVTRELRLSLPPGSPQSRD